VCSGKYVPKITALLTLSFGASFWVSALSNTTASGPIVTCDSTKTTLSVRRCRSSDPGFRKTSGVSFVRNSEINKIKCQSCSKQCVRIWEMQHVRRADAVEGRGAFP